MDPRPGSGLDENDDGRGREQDNLDFPQESTFGRAARSPAEVACDGHQSPCPRCWSDAVRATAGPAAATEWSSKKPKDKKPVDKNMSNESTSQYGCRIPAERRRAVVQSREMSVDLIGFARRHGLVVDTLPTPDEFGIHFNT
jgi:hypothetical protein